MAMLYHVALFAHITGALIYFVGVGLEVIVLRNLLRANRRAGRSVATDRSRDDQALPAMHGAHPRRGRLRGAHRMGIWTAWIDVALAALIVFNVLGSLVNGQRFRAIGQLAGVSPGGEITDDLKRRIYDPTLRTSIHIMGAAALSIVFLMTVKPGLLGALATITAAVAVGWLSTLIREERQRAQMEVPAARMRLESPSIQLFYRTKTSLDRC
jgi:hypothetical protein